jgi:hypothetical protein
MQMKAIELINKERAEQIAKHGRTLKRDKEQNTDGQLAEAANKLLFHGNDIPEAPLPWDRDIWARMCAKPRRERLIIAGALLLAEEDRLGMPGAYRHSIKTLCEEIDNPY